MRKLTALLCLLLPLCAGAQQLQTQSAPQPANVKYANGVSPGYALTKGSGLTLNISSGTAQCVDQLAEYAGGTKTMTDNTVNYVYLDPAQDCAPVVNTTGFLQGTVWLGKVTTSSGGISTITDDVRTPFAISKVAISGNGGTGGGTNNQGTVALTGCGASWTSGLNFTVSPCTYLIAGTQYASAQTDLTLATADPTDDRIDVIAVDNTGTAVVITGTPSGTPAEPSVDPASQLRLIAVTVPAAGTAPSGITETDLYLENTEWTCAASSNFNCGSTSNPFAGSDDIEASGAAAGNNITLTKPSGTVDLSTYANLVLYIRSKAAWPNAKSLSVFWLNGSSVVGASVSLKTGNFGFSSSTTGTYQQVVIPLGSFGTGTNAVNKLKIAVAGGGGSIGFYADNISIQSGVTGSAGGPQTLTFEGTAPIVGPGTVPVGGTVIYSCPTCNTGTAAQSLANVSHKWLNSYDASTGLFTQTQPNYSDLAGPPTLPANTTSTSHQFLNSYDSSTGSFGKGQPACGDLSDSSGGCSMSTTAGGDLSGTLPSPTVAKVNGVSFPSSPSTHSVPVTTASNTDTYKVLPDCPDSGGNHLNFSQSTDAFSCGTSLPSQTRAIPFGIGSPGGTALTAGANDVDYTPVPFACTITGYTLIADAGTVTVKFWKKATGTAIPTSSDSISTSGVSISAGTTVHSSTTSDFTTTTVSANDIMAMKVTTVSGAAYVTGTLTCTIP